MLAGRIDRLSVENFRSLKKISMPLDHLTIYLGANGTGKTNIYRSIELCHHAAIGDLSKWLAESGGMGSAFWAGANRSHDSNRIEITVDVGDYRYHLELGVKGPVDAAFDGEPLIKAESIEYLSNGRKYSVLERNGPAVTVRGPENKKQVLDISLLKTQTALSALPAEMIGAEIAAIRGTFANWRFYHSFRVDTDAPIRKNCKAVTSTQLDADGENLAAVFATLEWIRQDSIDLKEIIALAFDGAELMIPEPAGEASFAMAWPDLPQRLFDQTELSDGTIQFLALCGALLSYHTPKLIVLNEPEASLHSDMMPALAKLITKANETSQLIVVTHSQRLAEEIENISACPIREVTKEKGETKLTGLNKIGLFAD